MHILQQMVLEFHKKMGQTIGDPRNPDLTADQELRLRLIDEELKELKDAIAAGDVIKTADGLADLSYVLAGCAAAWGIDLASVVDEVHRSNMTKEPGTEATGGKAIKGPDFSPAEIESVLKDASENFDCGPDGWWLRPTKCGVCGRRTSKSAGCYEGKCVRKAKKLPMAEPAQAEGKPYTVNSKAVDELLDENYPLQSPDSWKNTLPAEMVPELHKTATVIERSDGVPGEIKGEMTAYGAYVFDCGCGRRHAVQAKMGTRGGLASFGQCECICGKAYMVDFRDVKNIKVTQTTIEELRKDS